MIEEIKEGILKEFSKVPMDGDLTVIGFDLASYIPADQLINGLVTLADALKELNAAILTDSDHYYTIGTIELVRE